MTPTITDIQRVVCADAKLPLSVMTSAERQFALSHPRQVAMYVAAALTSRSLPYVGWRFGGRHHATVIAACQAVEANPSLLEQAERCRKALEASGGNWKRRWGAELAACRALADGLRGWQTNGAELASGPKALGNDGVSSGEDERDLTPRAAAL